MNEEQNSSLKRNMPYWIIGIISVVSFFIILFPDISGINKIEPLVFNLPFFVFMEILIAIIIAAMVIINYFVQKKRGDL